ncbi:MAG: Fic family protein [Desulfobacterales bacterium]|nr:Fic family protein [Desulfobacterales bacterium]
MKPIIIKLIAEIDEFKGYWRGMRELQPDTLSNFRILATIESIGSSTRIEGAKLNDSQVSALLKDIDIRSFRSRDEQEVAGYAKTIGLIHNDYKAIDLSENNIKYLHKSLLRFSEKDRWHLGDYKKHPNHVAAFDSDGNEIGIVFETGSPFETPRMMTALVERTRGLLLDGETHPILAIADFVVRFLAVHPFQDGNGRLSRVLSNLLLLQNGYEFVQFSSHERIVEANKDRYYQALRKTQKTVFQKRAISQNWAEFFLAMLKKQKDELIIKIDREKRALAIPELSQQILSMAGQHRVTVAFLTKILGVNRNTVKKHLQALTRNQQLVKHGKGRGVFYSRF